MILGGRSQSPASSDKTKRLADLFRPPFDIMYQGDFENVSETWKGVTEVNQMLQKLNHAIAGT